MTNNLRNVKKELCKFAKRCQDFKYTDSALITFLITGAVSWQYGINAFGNHWSGSYKGRADKKANVIYERSSNRIYKKIQFIFIKMIKQVLSTIIQI